MKAYCFGMTIACPGCGNALMRLSASLASPVRCIVPTCPEHGRTKQFEPLSVELVDVAT